jgi:monoamine oxidase
VVRRKSAALIAGEGVVVADLSVGVGEQGNIHFAGEHCSQDFQGYMDGGAAEGVRAANETLADLK